MSSILTLNQQGQPLQWSTWQDAVTYKAKDLIIWEMGSTNFTRYGGTSRMTGLQSTVNYSTIIAVKGNHFPSREVPTLNNQSLFGRDLNTCAYCGKNHLASKLTRDHVIPRAKGGANNWMNCVTACKGCNNMKGDSLLENLRIDLLYVPYVPTREEALIMKNRNILGCQMEFLQKMLPKHSRLLIN